MDAARTARLFGLYPLVSGLAIAAAPRAIVRLAGLPADDGPWLRILGLTSAALGVQYVVAGRDGAQGFIRASVALRLAVAAGLAAEGARSREHRLVAAFAVPEVGGALWTAAALRRDQARSIANR